MKLHRKALGLSQAKLAEIIDTASNYIALIESCKRFPTPQMIERIAFALKIDTPDLFSLEKPKSLSIKDTHEQILSDVDQILTKRLEALR
jgi:transcriptional regulator with XRE-family HTH domain